MNLHEVVTWLSSNWFNVLQWIGDIIAFDAIVKQLALKYGYKQLGSICDLIANDLGFILDVLSSIPQVFNKNSQPPQPTTNQKDKL